MKHLLWAAFLLHGLAASAQGLKIEKRVFKFGMDFVYATPGTGIYAPDVPLKPAANVGFAADYRIRHSPLRFRIGGQYHAKGYITKTNVADNQSYRTNFSLHYLDLPIDLTLTAGNRLVKFYASAGGYVGVGIFGQKIVRAQGDLRFIRGSNDTTSVLRYEAFGKQSNRFSRLDYGLNAAIGIQGENVQFGIAYSHGLANLLNINQVAIYNRALGLFFNYRFDGF